MMSIKRTHHSNKEEYSVRSRASYSYEISIGLGSSGNERCKGFFAYLRQSLFSQRLHSGTAPCDFGPSPVLSNGLSGHCRHSRGSLRPSRSSGIGKGSTLHDTSEIGSKASKRGQFDDLLRSVFDRANSSGLTSDQNDVSIDSTGLESHHVSRHFLHRQQRNKQYTQCPKLTAVCDNETHLIAGIDLGLAPSADASSFEPAMRQAASNLSLYRVLADKAYDSERFHALCRKELGVTTTAIPLNLRRAPHKPPSTKYRKLMYYHFPSNIYKQRAQAECVFSRFKRRLGANLTAKSAVGRDQERRLRVLTYDLMILAEA